MAVGRRAAAGPHFACFDGLRAMAVVAVLVHHSALITGSDKRSLFGTVFDHLDVGLAVFFLISGFLLYRPFVAAHLSGEPRPATGSYLRRRAFRILPAYWLALTATVLYFGRPSAVKGIWDWVVLYGLGQIYSAAHLRDGLAQAWSLCVEVSFYLFLPVYALVVRRLVGQGDRVRALRVEVAGLVVLYGSSVAFRAWKLAQTPQGDEALRWLPANLDYFALGMALAVASAQLATKGPAKGHSALARIAGASPGGWWAMAGAVWLLTLRPGLPRERAYGAAISLELQFLYGLVALLLLLPAVFGPQRRGEEWGGIRGFLASEPMTVIGRLSYGVYLWHIFVLVAWMQLTGFEWGAGRLPRLFLAAAAGSLVLAALSWVVVERPAMALGRRGRARREPPDTRYDTPGHVQPAISTISTARVPPGASYSTVSPSRWPTSAVPSGDAGEITSTSSRRSSIEPTR